MQAAVRAVRVDEAVADYLLALAEASRVRDDVYLGVSTRGALMHYRAAQALAFLQGRDYVVPDDVKRMAVPVLGHRVIAKHGHQGGLGDAGDTVVADLLRTVPVPVSQPSGQRDTVTRPTVASSSGGSAGYSQPRRSSSWRSVSR